MQVSNLRRSTRKHKKYMTDVFYNGKFHKNLHFGDIRYGQYKDSTTLKLFSHMDHNDPDRKRLFHSRHKNNTGICSMLTKEFLW